MHTLFLLRTMTDDIVPQIRVDSHSEEGFCLTFSFAAGGGERHITKAVKRLISKHSLTWLRPHPVTWELDVAAMCEWMDSKEFVEGFSWLQGVVKIVPKYVQHPKIAHLEGPVFTGGNATFSFVVYREDYELNKSTKLFLSHKGTNKAMVRQYFRVLKRLGFDPWLDEDALSWGSNLERGLLQGFKDSCAAIFFITPHFKDENYLATEIDYAIREKREKGEKFAIVAVRFTDKDGTKGEVPELLRPYVYGEPKSHLQALDGILKAIPLEVGPVDWKSGLV